MSFDTKRIALTAGAAPIDLAADSDLALTELGIAQGWLADPEFVDAAWSATPKLRSRRPATSGGCRSCTVRRLPA